MSYGTVQAEKMTTESGYSLGAGNASSFKNRIINGGMVIAQRGTSAVTSDGSYIVDRWLVAFNNDGAYSAQQDSSAPAGFSYSAKWTVTTADASLSASQYTQLRQAIEGYNTADLAWGTASAKSITVSFWVKSSVTGTFAASIRNFAGDRSYVFTYTISSANTWEQKTATIPGCTDSTWQTTNSVGLYLTFDLGTGSTYQTTANSWAAGNYWSTSGSVALMNTVNATWFVTGVQLEVGTVATSFDFRSYGTELQLCQRYYWSESNTIGFLFHASGSDPNAHLPFKHPVTMRATPTVVVTVNNGTPGSQFANTTSVEFFSSGIGTGGEARVTSAICSAEL